MNLANPISVKPITPARAAQLLQGSGYKGKIDRIGEYVMVRSGAQGANFQLYFYKEQPKSENDVCSSIQFSASWGGVEENTVQTLIDKCNDFNRDYRYAKGYVSGQANGRSITIDLDFNFPDGVSDQAFGECVDLFEGCMANFLQKVGSR